MQDTIQANEAARSAQRGILLICLILFLILLIPGLAKPASSTANGNLQLTEVANLQSGQPISISHAGDNSNRLFIVERAGVIRILHNNQVLANPFLDIHETINSGSSERGLLGLAFDPDYTNNGYFYVNAINLDGDSEIRRYQVSRNDPNQADPDSMTILISLEQPMSNHNGGDLRFGPDGMLYIAFGDGGGANDMFGSIGNGQSTETLLGKLLRIDVRNSDTSDGLAYDIPSDNPFVDSSNPNTRKEIWAYGLRNPWRFTFDRETGDMWIADVGQNQIEEVNFQAANSQGGENYGWRCREGNENFNWQDHCESLELVEPIITYKHGDGDCSITGGFRYRGKQYEQLQGVYIYGDYCTGNIWGARLENNTWQSTLLITTNLRITSFGEDEQGEIYVSDMRNNKVYRLDLMSQNIFLPNVTNQG